MSTGIESWTGNILDIGPIYPFVGTEILLWIAGMIFWILWHFWQTKHENEEIARNAANYTQGEDLLKAIRNSKMT